MQQFLLQHIQLPDHREPLHSSRERGSSLPKSTPKSQLRYPLILLSRYVLIIKLSRRRPEPSSMPFLEVSLLDFMIWNTKIPRDSIIPRHRGPRRCLIEVHPHDLRSPPAVLIVFDDIFVAVSLTPRWASVVLSDLLVVQF